MKQSFKSILFATLKAQGAARLVGFIKSVRTDGNSARVQTVNLCKQDRARLEKVLGLFEQGHFDGMTDCYEYDHAKPKQAVMFKFVFLNNEFSPEVVAVIKKTLAENFLVVDDTTSQARLSCWYDQAVRRKLCEIETLAEVGA